MELARNLLEYSFTLFYFGGKSDYYNQIEKDEVPLPLGSKGRNLSTYFLIKN